MYHNVISSLILMFLQKILLLFAPVSFACLEINPFRFFLPLESDLINQLLNKLLILDSSSGLFANMDILKWIIFGWSVCISNGKVLNLLILSLTSDSKALVNSSFDV